MHPIGSMLILITLLGLAPAAHAALKVFACEPEWGALAGELGGDKVEVAVATTARQDPHYIQARPSLIAKARQADLLVCTGADLEIGWLPLLLRQAGNPAIQPGAAGHFLAAEQVRLLEAPARLDRRDGDIHPFGNPHIHTDPRNVARVAAALSRRLGALDPANAGHYRARHDDFARRWADAIGRWEAQAAPLRGTPVVVLHRSWAYLEQWLGLETLAALEPKPGIPATSAHLARVLAQVAERPAKMVIHAAYQDDRAARWLSQRAGIPVVTLPFTVGGSDRANDLFGLYEDTIGRLLEGAR